MCDDHPRVVPWQHDVDGTVRHDYYHATGHKYPEYRHCDWEIFYQRRSSAKSIYSLWWTNITCLFPQLHQVFMVISVLTLMIVDAVIRCSICRCLNWTFYFLICGRMLKQFLYIQLLPYCVISALQVMLGVCVCMCVWTCECTISYFFLGWIYCSWHSRSNWTQGDQFLY